MESFFDEAGNLNINDLILQQPMYVKIMEDGVVTEEELSEQKERVSSLLKQLEKNSSSEQIKIVRELLAELSVLIAISNI